MPRIILIDDSASARTLIGLRLRDAGFEVFDAPDGTTGAELALGAPPDAVVTDLWMPGISGLQLCRLLKAEPATSRVPVVLLTASDDRRTRFWARCAGAAGYVTKTDIDKLITFLQTLGEASEPVPSITPMPSISVRGGQGVQERLSQLLDAALYDSTVAGEVRALAHSGDLEQVFSDLSRLASDVVAYRWLALIPQGDNRLMIHTPKSNRAAAEREAREAFGLIPEISEERRKAAESMVFAVEDNRALGGESAAAPLVAKVRFADVDVATIALAPSRRGASHEDRRVLAIMAAELGGPLRMVSLVAEARRLAATDTLTGLMNRRAFLEAINKDRMKNEKNIFPWSLLLLDVDFFKKVNDTHGHDAGDIVLQGVAAVLSRMARKSDCVSRWGGEEFVLALVQTAETGARIAAERVRRAIADARFPLPNGEILQATASIGLASAANEDWQIDDLIARADKAMYAAKHRGRNRVETA